MSGQPEEFYMFVERFMHFMNLWTVYTDFLSGRYVPRVGSKDDESITGMTATLIFVLYAFFYSLVEDSPDGVNAFRLWRLRFPEEEAAIAPVEAQVSPFVAKLRVFRNRIGFTEACHGRMKPRVLKYSTSTPEPRFGMQ